MTNLTSLAVLGLSLVTGCLNRGDGVDTDGAESAIESSETAEAEGNVMMSAIDGANVAGVAAATSDQIAAQIAANIVAKWNPRACATVAQTGATITVTYADCTGPRGLVHVSGELTLVVAVALNGTISLHGTSDELQVNGATLTVDANAVYSGTGTNHTLAVTTHGVGTGARGLAVEHDGEYTIGWDTATLCKTLAGNWSTEIGVATRSTQATVQRCADACPTGSVVRQTRAGQTLTVTFDGLGTATWSSSTGKTGSVTLACAR